MSAFLLFFSPVVEEAGPPPGAVLIYSGGTTEPGDNPWLGAGTAPFEFFYFGTDVYATGIETITDLNCSSRMLDGELDLTGFASLTTLIALANSLTSVTLSGCVFLADCDVSNNLLTTLDVSEAFDNLVTLRVANNLLTSLVTTGCVEIQTFQLNNNPLTAVDFASLVGLITVQAYSTDIVTANFTGVSALEGVHFGPSAALTTLDVTNCPVLTAIEIYNCSALTTLTLSGNNNLTYINGELTALTTVTVMDASTFTIGNFISSALIQAGLDALLADCNNHGNGSGNLQLQVSGGVTPTDGAANSNLVNLQGKGWSININP